jgi:hypothetical protein
MASIVPVRDEAAWPTQICLPDRSGQGRLGQPIMKLVNETFAGIAATSPSFCRGVAPISTLPQEFRVPVRPYATKLLTMIKKVLIATISFASLNQ